MSQRLALNGVRFALHCFLISGVLTLISQAQDVPVGVVVKEETSFKFKVKASIKIAGTFDKWDATLTYASNDVTAGVLDIKIQADSLNCGNGIVEKTMKGKDYFDVEHYPLITFHSTKVTQTGPVTFEIDGDYTMRGVTKPQKLTLTLSGKGSGNGQVQGTMYFDRKDYGITKKIPFVTVADRIEVIDEIRFKQTGGPRLVFKQ